MGAWRQGVDSPGTRVKLHPNCVSILLTRVSGHCLITEITMRAPRAANVGHRPPPEKGQPAQAYQTPGASSSRELADPISGTGSGVGGVSHPFTKCSQIPSLVPHVGSAGQRLQSWIRTVIRSRELSASENKRRNYKRL